MRSESEIRLMMGHAHGLVQKYQAIKEQAVANGDQKAERAAWTKRSLVRQRIRGIGLGGRRYSGIVRSGGSRACSTAPALSSATRRAS